MLLFYEDGKRSDSIFDSLPVMNLLFPKKLRALNHFLVYFEPSVKKKKKDECFRTIRIHKGKRESGHAEQTNPRVSPPRNWGIKWVLGPPGSLHLNICLSRRKHDKTISSMHHTCTKHLFSAWLGLAPTGCSRNIYGLTPLSYDYWWHRRITQVALALK